MIQYLNLVKNVLSNGRNKDTRTGNTISLHGNISRYDLRNGFPILTTKYVNINSVASELEWFLKGSSNIKELINNDVHIWDEDAYGYTVRKHGGFILDRVAEHFGIETSLKDYDLYKLLLAEPDLFPFNITSVGRMYGYQWRKFNGELDQISNALDKLKTNPLDRAIIVTAYNPLDIEQQAINTCHTMFQLLASPMTLAERIEHASMIFEAGTTLDYIEHELDSAKVPKYFLDLALYQRSGDIFLGVPYNISNYSLLLSIFAKESNMIPREFIHTIGDAHIYKNHISQLTQMLDNDLYRLPVLVLDKDTTLNSFTHSHVRLIDYNSHKFLHGKLNTGHDKCKV
jgi:thymidylate synthase